MKRNIEEVENEIEKLLALLPEAACIVDQKEVFLEINENFEKYFGIKKEDVIGREINALGLPSNVPKAMEKVLKLHWINRISLLMSDLSDCEKKLTCRLRQKESFLEKKPQFYLVSLKHAEKVI